MQIKVHLPIDCVDPDLLAYIVQLVEAGVITRDTGRKLHDMLIQQYVNYLKIALTKELTSDTF